MRDLDGVFLLELIKFNTKSLKGKNREWFKWVKAEIGAFAPATCRRTVLIFSHEVLKRTRIDLDELKKTLEQCTERTTLFKAEEAYRYLLVWGVGACNSDKFNNDQRVKGELAAAWKKECERERGAPEHVHAYHQIIEKALSDIRTMRAVINEWKGMDGNIWQPTKKIINTQFSVIERAVLLEKRLSCAKNLARLIFDLRNEGQQPKATVILKKLAPQQYCPENQFNAGLWCGPVAPSTHYGKFEFSASLFC